MSKIQDYYISNAGNVQYRNQAYTFLSETNTTRVNNKSKKEGIL